MSTQIQFRRGNKAASDAFTGAIGEMVVNTDDNRMVTHNASRLGGFPHATFIDEINNYFNAATATGTNTIAVTLPYAPVAYTAYMEVLFKPANNNTSAATLNVNALGVKDIKKDDGAGALIDLVSGDLKANIPVKCIYDGTRFIAQISSASSTDVQSFTGSGTWTKPSKGTYAIILGWGGGGSGGTGSGNGGGGGGGGGFDMKFIPLASLGGTETVTIGAGGAAQGTANSNGNAGGNTTFGSWLTAYGGGRGGGGSLGAGGGGGGNLGAGGNATTTTAGVGGIGNGQTTALAAGQNGSIYGGAGGFSSGAPPSTMNFTSKFGGGGGGVAQGAASVDSAGGSSDMGGGGGGAGSSSGNSAAGTSKGGGNGGAGANGGNTATSGVQPAGGGGGSLTGTSGAGGAGKIVVIVV